MKADFHRLEQGLRISSIGIGTYRGKRDPATDASYLSALRTAFRGGINLVDTALIYRDQQSEKLVGAAIREYGQRDDLVVCTKGGYLAPEADGADGVHSIAPDFLGDQLSRSLRNLGLPMVDVYYIHNPEVAGELGMTVIASAPLGQGRLSGDLAGALQFARSAPGIAAAVVGMSSSRHVDDTLAAAAAGACR